MSLLNRSRLLHFPTAHGFFSSQQSPLRKSPPQGPHCRPGLAKPALNKLRFSSSGVEFTLPSRLAQARAPPLCSKALPSCTQGRIWNQISVHGGIPRAPFPRMQNEQTNSMLFVTATTHFTPSHSVESQ